MDTNNYNKTKFKLKLVCMNEAWLAGKFHGKIFENWYFGLLIIDSKKGISIILFC